MSTFENRANASAKTGLHLPSGKNPVADLQIRRLDNRDEADIRRFLITLDETSRVHRFNQLATDAYLAVYANTSLMTATWIAGAFTDNRLRGFVEIYEAAGQGFAEAAFLVESESRRRGIGSALLEKAAGWAARSNVPKLRMIFSGTNLPMRKLASNADARFAIHCDDITADLDTCLAPI